MVMTRERPKKEQMVSINELERLFQLGIGATCAFGKVSMTLDSRHRPVGNSVCSTHYRLVTDCVPLPVMMSKKVMAVTVNEVHPKVFDLMLENIPQVDERDSKMIEFVLERANGWKPPDMDLACAGPAYHCSNAFPVNAKHEASIMAKMEQFCERQQFYLEEEDDFDPECDYSPCLFKMKGEDRIDPEMVCKDGAPTLFVPRSFLRLDDDDDEEPVVKAELVLLVPDGAQVKITAADVVYDAETEG